MQTKGVILESYSQIKEVFDQHKVQKPFVCCGKSFQKTKLFEYLKQFDIVVFDHIRPNPRFEDMIDAAKLFVEEGCDFIIGAGGGSPIDSAKMIRLMTTNDISKCLTEPMVDNDIKQLFIPTTAGTGAEASKTSVFYVNENEKKSIGDLAFLPDYVILDESLLTTLPDYQRKCTCLDALCHGIESYWNVKATDESREYAKKAILGFVQHRDGYIANTKEGNRGMLMASYYAGKAINITGTTAPHAMCYSITMNCGTAHGHSCAVGLSVIWKYMMDNNCPGNIQNVNDVFDEIGVMLGGKNAREGLEIFDSIIKEYGLDYPRTDEKNIPIFASRVDVSRLGNNPAKLELEDVVNIYKEVFSR